MKRELAFALDARSQFGCFIGRTRSSESSPARFSNVRSKEQFSNDRSEKSINEVHVNRRSKRVKTGIPEADSVNVDKFMGENEAAAAEVVNGEEDSPAAEVINAGEESTAVEVFNGGEEAAAVEVDKGEEEGGRSAEKVYVKRKKSKKQVTSSTPKRFTRSALKEKDENLEDVGTPSRRKLELKMSKKIGLDRMPTNMRGLLETGLLEGFRVYYNFGTEGERLQGQIKGVGILCSCSLCESTKIISPSQFEMHACKSYRHAIKHIFLVNGKSLLELIEICKASASDTLEVALQTVISSLPAKGPSICTKCNTSFESSSTENLLTCNSCLNKKEVDAEPSVATRTEVSSSTAEPKASESNSLSISLDRKTKRGRKRKLVFILSSKSALKPIKSAGYKLSQDKIKSRILRRSSTPRAIKSAAKYTSPQQNSRKKLTIKNQQLHWSVFQKGGLPDGTELTYVAQGKVTDLKKCHHMLKIILSKTINFFYQQKLLDGYKWGSGIFCSCCKTEISASQFEAHAGWASRKKPYENIYISNGVSLHEYAVSMKKNEKGRCPLKYNDDLCRVCWDGGDLLLCDGCPRSFHQECSGESSIPQGKWYCRYCQQSLKFDGENENAFAAGRVTGIDPIEQIMTRCIRIVKHPENSDLVACVLCRCHDFSKNVFNERTVIVCDQCEKEYHIGCLREHNMADLKKQKNNNDNSEVDFNSEMKFVVLSGKNATRENRKLLAQTVDIFHKENLEPRFCRNALCNIDNRLKCSHSWNSSCVGEDIAELPIVATSKCNQGKGYFQLLFTCIERLLSSMKIKKIVLPA
ncbi:hypothetical protein E3N88_45017 [Mikania micrantha]|uniref:PHD-type domain-containing protein n=1 Tax=Mikania micrantha TaxID=192012 RepID=A0A5N6LCP8_9ASTR|nr:hypothetical protein E3N88_45017 [Mikania micrantha]